MRPCGRSDLCLSALGLGCWAFGGGNYWGPQDQGDVDRVVRRAVDLGVNYFDTAEAYNSGRSESSLGAAIRGLPRDQLVLGTKIAPSSTEPATLIEHCEASLRRLGTDYIDLYMVHWPILPHSVVHFGSEHCPPVHDAFTTLVKLQSEGKIRYIGVSNFGVEVLEEARATGAEIAANELPYNLLARAIECQVLPHCRAIGVGVIGYMALMQGLLAGIYRTLDDVPLWQRRTRHFSPTRAGEHCRHDGPGAEEETREAIAAVGRIAAEHGRRIAEISIQWAVAGRGISSVLVGARNKAELEANVCAAEQPLPPAVIEQLNQATQPLLKKLGPSFDYYQHPEKDRTRPIHVG